MNAVAVKLYIFANMFPELRALSATTEKKISVHMKSNLTREKKNTFRFELNVIININVFQICMNNKRTIQYNNQTEQNHNNSFSNTYVKC